MLSRHTHTHTHTHRHRPLLRPAVVVSTDLTHAQVMTAVRMIQTTKNTTAPTAVPIASTDTANNTHFNLISSVVPAGINNVNKAIVDIKFRPPPGSLLSLLS